MREMLQFYISDTHFFLIRIFHIIVYILAYLDKHTGCFLLSLDM